MLLERRDEIGAKQHYGKNNQNNTEPAEDEPAPPWGCEHPAPNHNNDLVYHLLAASGPVARRR
jgi:hypothetical protein